MKTSIVRTIFKDHFEVYGQTCVLGRQQYHAAGNIMTCRTSKQYLVVLLIDFDLAKALMVSKSIQKHLTIRKNIQI